MQARWVTVLFPSSMFLHVRYLYLVPVYKNRISEEGNRVLSVTADAPDHKDEGEAIMHFIAVEHVRLLRN
jgi:hypothetical protein